MITFYKKIFFIHFLFLIISLQIDLNSQSIVFNRLTTNNGLSNNYVSSIIQDQFGFLWFATDDGLNRFDGYEFKVYRNNPADKNSISDNSIWTLSLDDSGKIWIGTKTGYINCYDPKLDKFTSWEIKSKLTNDNPITTIYIDKKSNLWIGTYRSGLYKLDPKTGKTINWIFNSNDPASISNNYVSTIAEDNFGNLWIGTYNGLNKFNPQKTADGFIRYFYDKNNPNTLTDNLIWSITPAQSEKNKLWIGTSNGLTELNTETLSFSRITIPNPDNLKLGTSIGVVVEEIINGEKILWINSYAGLIRYNVNQNKFDRFLSDKKNSNSLLSNQIIDIFKDRSGVLWIATDNGLNYFSQKNIKFNSTLTTDNYIDDGVLSKANVKAITKTSDGNLWIGTEEGIYYSRNINGKISFSKSTFLASENIWTLAADSKDDLWIGTYGSGLFHLNYKTNLLTKKNILDDLTKSLSKNFVKTLLVDNKNNIWIGYWGAGLVRLNTKTGEIKNWLHNANDPHSLSHDDVWIIYQDSKNRLWIGTNGGGLNLFEDSNGEKFYRLSADKNNPDGLSSNSIYSIIESKNKIPKNNTTTLWVGTNNGLNKLVISNSNDKSLSPENIKVKTYTIKDGLADNSVKSIVEDENGNLWLGTSSGITFYDLKNNLFINYSAADGVIGNDFNFSAAISYKNNLIFLGSTAGLNYFNPNTIKQSTYKPTIAITDFQIFNKSIKVGESSELRKNIFETDKIMLAHTQNVFSFQFAAFDYNSPGSIKYAYKMEGFDKDWIESESRRFITYTNLNPGEYIFRVKSTNSDGVWCNNEKAIRVIITPPWWQTEWAIVLYFIVFVLGVWGIIKFQANRTKLQHELKMREFESYHLREIEKMKSRFFANLSHEFRTPLMLIKGPLEALLNGKIKENISEYYKMLLNNTEKLQQLIDQLLELSQLETESIPLKTEALDLLSVVKSCFDNFQPLAKQKNISFSFGSETESAIAMVDRDKLEKIINNLLSNAFKFTPNGGNISVNLSTQINSDFTLAKVSVKDSGIGIPKEHQEKIFNRFYQIDDSSRRSFGGSGIGLALVKELVTLHKWNIKVNSEEGAGAEFIIEIPLTEENIKTEHYQLHQNEKENFIEKHSGHKTISENEGAHEPKDKSLILFVEDSEDVRKYVYDLLKTDYDVLLEESAEAGIEVTKNNLPDLIISDVMMPGMDGFEFCKKIKSDWKTSHIPVILLTAKVTHQSKLEGLELGADDYITKPFDYNELFIRIKNLLTQRKQLKEKFSKEILFKAESITENKSDQEFITKLISVIEKYLHDENFDSEVLAKEVFLSRSRLTRKLHLIYGRGPGEFIRNYKLNRAAKMIIENKLSITQIAYEVGFGSPAQFTRAFQKHFNCLPSEFKGLNRSTDFSL